MKLTTDAINKTMKTKTYKEQVLIMLPSAMVVQLSDGRYGFYPNKDRPLPTLEAGSASRLWQMARDRYFGENDMGLD